MARSPEVCCHFPNVSKEVCGPHRWVAPYAPQRQRVEAGPSRGGGKRAFKRTLPAFPLTTEASGLEFHVKFNSGENNVPWCDIRFSFSYW